VAGAPEDETEPDLVPPNALRGVQVGISVSESADLSRLGLGPSHCDLAVAELARAVFIAGGSIVYGGRIVPRGFTDILIDEVRRYREDRDALILCVPESEHRRLSNDELSRREQALHSSAALVCLDTDGQPLSLTDRAEPSGPVDIEAALTGMRRHLTERCNARVVVGGSLRSFQGTMPGVIEESILAVQAHQPLYVAGGFGGAAAAVARALGHDGAAWFPPNYPDGSDESSDALAVLASAASDGPLTNDGLSVEERQQLAATHRPGDIAAIVVTGLGRLRTS
jgi:hypothetical protein